MPGWSAPSSPVNHARAGIREGRSRRAPTASVTSALVAIRRRAGELIRAIESSGAELDTPPDWEVWVVDVPTLTSRCGTYWKSLATATDRHEEAPEVAASAAT